MAILHRVQVPFHFLASERWFRLYKHRISTSLLIILLVRPSIFTFYQNLRSLITPILSKVLVQYVFLIAYTRFSKKTGHVGMGEFMVIKISSD